MASVFESLSIYLAAALSPLNQHADILFAGDAMQHSAQIDAARTLAGSYDYSECFEGVSASIADADYAVVNLETPLGGAPYSGYPCFCAPDSYASALKDAGFDMFLTANNHTLDRRDKGLVRTVAVLDSLGVDHIGTYGNDSCRRSNMPFIKDIKGFKVGFLNYTYGTNGFTPGRDVIVDYIDTLKISADIHAAREAGAEILALAVHWGDEYNLLPNAYQKKLGRYLLDKGVDLVIGGHPHVIQPMELHTDGSDSLKRQLLVYSLGNFISNMKTSDTRGGAMVKVTLKRAVDGRPYVDKASYIPVFTLPASSGHNFRLVYATDTLLTGEWEQRRRLFLSRAKAVFDKHNIDVEIESR